MKREVIAVSLSQCKAMYGNLTYISESEMFKKYPPHLVSLPGSGNSWVRLLIEYETGIYTGSMDTMDFELLMDGGFPGEKACGIRTSAIRAHPHFFDFVNDRLRLRHTFQRDKCKRGLVRELKRMIVLVRNPFDALWSYYQYLQSLSRSNYLTEKSFNVENWVYYSPHIAKFWDIDFYRIILPLLHSYNPMDVTIIRYEDLLNPSINLETLNKLMRFMGHTSVSIERLRCAFILADKPSVHRRTDDPARITSLKAYFGNGFESSYGTQSSKLLCKLRPHFAGFSDKFNYTLVPTGYEAAANVCSSHLPR